MLHKHAQGGQLLVKEKADLKVLLRLPDAATTEQVSAVFAVLKLVRARKSPTGKTPKLPPKVAGRSWFKVASQPKPSFSFFAKPASDTDALKHAP